jgi:hypothetical protein
MKNDPENLTIGGVASAAGGNVETIRGHRPPPARSGVP